MPTLAWVVLRRMSRAISEALHIETFGFFSSPPSRQDKYRTWCEKRGVQPYPFANAEPPNVRARWL